MQQINFIVSLSCIGEVLFLGQGARKRTLNQETSPPTMQRGSDTRVW